MLNNLLDKLPAGPVMFFGGIYFFMPVLPEPHLWQKAMMILDGVPLRPIDVFDIFVHSAAGALALAMFLRTRQKTAENDRAERAQGE